jgi:uncharacterized protein
MGIATLSPAYKILFNGLPNPLLEERLLSMQIHNSIEGDVDDVVLSLDDRPILANEHLPILPIGTKVFIWLGWKPALVNMGTFHLDSWDLSNPPSKLTITAKSLDFKGHFFDQKTYTWDKITLKLLVESIAAKHGLIPYVSEDYNFLITEQQDVESDAAFLTRLARKYNAIFKVAQEKLLFLQYNAFQSLSGQILGSVAVSSLEATQWSSSYKESREFGKVEATWMEKDSREYRTTYYPKVSRSNKVFQIRKTFLTERDAFYAAKAKYESFERDKQRIDVQCNGNPRITAGGRVLLAGFRAEIDGVWVVSQVSHSLDSQGFQTHFSAYRFVIEG